jgi:hypothetical protein
MRKETTDSRLIKKYGKLLRELAGLRLREFPQALLPAPKKTIEETLTAQMKENSEEKRITLRAALSTLGSFVETPGVVSDFVAHLITRPTVVTLVYTVWLGFRSESWLWTVNIALIPLAAGGVLAWRYEVGVPRNFLKRLVYVLLEIVAIGSLTIVTLKLAFLSGFWGLFQSIGKTDWLGIMLALAAIFLGYHMAKYTNRIFFFLGADSSGAK